MVHENTPREIAY
ncbi:Protein of unknown function [Bacillus wiedmannii]|uniref:Uncharacterized protein n=1 Tax=Bacillus wiedmannii TaxID=1890302 RepID=A0A1C4EAX0_9BACI|nr:Protein of unknown function [Bacillus wiedmannii]